MTMMKMLIWKTSTFNIIKNINKNIFKWLGKLTRDRSKSFRQIIFNKCLHGTLKTFYFKI